MQSKKSYCSKKIIFNNFLRSWPVWISYLFVLFMVGPLMIWAEGGFRNNLLEIIVDDMVSFGFGGSMIFAVISALTQFAYLQKKRACSFYHSLPISRTGLYISGWISGLMCLFLPNILIFAICNIQTVVSYGVCYIGKLALWLLIISVEEVFFYAIAVLCIMITGQIIASGVLYFVTIYIVSFFESLIHAFVQGVWYGYCEGEIAFLNLFKPYDIINKIETHRIFGPGVEELIDIRLSHVGEVLISIGIVAVLLFAVSLFLYTKRKSENSGDTVAIDCFKGAFAVLFTMLFSLSVTDMLVSGFFTRYENTPTICIISTIFLLFFTAFGYFAVRMIMCKTFRVFKRYMKSSLVLLGTVLVLCLCVCLDLFGYVNRIPDEEDISECSIYVYEFNPLSINKKEMVRELHREILDNKDRTISNGAEISINYSLKNHSVVSRNYIVEKDGKIWENVKEFICKNWEEDLMDADCENSLVRCTVSGSGYYLSESYHYEFDKDDGLVLLNAIRQDVKEGNLDALAARGEDNYYTSESEYEGNLYVFMFYGFSEELKQQYDLTEYSKAERFKILPRCQNTINAINSLITEKTN